MHRRPLALVCVLALGDYLLWNWSLGGSHEVIALISGLTLPPLAIALIWLLALNLARGLARGVSRGPARTAQGRGHSAKANANAEAAVGDAAHPVTPEAPASSSSKLAA